jgi:serine/threonine protein kinase
LLLKLLIKDPKLRITAPDALEHSWFSNEEDIDLGDAMNNF